MHNRTVNAVQRRMLAGRAAAKGMTVEQYLDWCDREHEEQCARYALISNHGLQMAVITQHAVKQGRLFVRSAS